MAARTAPDGKWVGRIARTVADGEGAREWLEMGGEKKADGKWMRRIARTAKMQPTNPNAHTYVNGYAVTQNNFLQ